MIGGVASPTDPDMSHSAITIVTIIFTTTIDIINNIITINTLPTDINMSHPFADQCCDIGKASINTLSPKRNSAV